MPYTKKEIHELVIKQREYFLTNETLNIDFRIQQLTKLKEMVVSHEDEILEALNKDLGRTKTEGYLCDIGPTIVEVNETIKGLRRWSKPENHFSGLMCFPSLLTKVYKVPYGVTLIISPFNFPFLLSFGVLIASLAAGNTAIIKTSSKSKYSTMCMKKLISDTFDEKYVALVDGGHDVADMCLEERFDKIFYTGSPKVARHVMEEASKNLTPVALELGGETGNWAIIRKDADIKDAARKIAFFKSCNAGQICININQIAVAKEIVEPFIDELKKAYINQLGEHTSDNEEYPKLIEDKVYDKCVNIVNQYKDKVVFGGRGNKKERKFDQTILYPINVDDEIVKQELFCPILPIVTYEDNKINELVDVVKRREHPLAMYLFTKDINWAKHIMQTTQYGGGCINEVCVHMMVKGVPFNGVGHSGMGAYHGEWGFREFSHPQTVLFGKTNFNLSLREHPYSKNGKESKMKILRIFEK